MTPADKARALLATLPEGATVGPWQVARSKDQAISNIETADRVVVGTSNNYCRCGAAVWILPSDAALIAAAPDLRDAVSALLAENERLSKGCSAFLDGLAILRETATEAVGLDPAAEDAPDAETALDMLIRERAASLSPKPEPSK